MESIKVCPECRKRIIPARWMNWREVGKDFIQKYIEPFLKGVPGSEKMGDYSFEKKVCTECVEQGSA
ncbi:MAG: hypothetical protein QGH26_00615 [Candidatus Pacebacteria bacterium]|nr:hypothetical protein [Candidatus Paceibacterota bacterium]MDP7159461.1 hypothetical protein [Candidatus Paceibacterota bacterium]MDP7365963.1 hypothetical protein [Candidatus Paceibacterota bacterium]